MRLTKCMTSSLIAATLASVPLLAHASSYTDEGLWRAAVLGAYSLETFDSLPSFSDVGSLPALGISFDPLNDGTQPTVQPYAFTGGVVRSGPNNLLNDRDYSLPARGPFTIRPINASTFVYGIGLWNVGGDDTLSLSFYNAAGGVIESVTSPVSSGFFGIVNTAGASKAVIDFVGGNGYAPVDDLQTAVRGTFVPTIPEPESYAMLLAGLGILGVVLRRRRSV